MHEKYFLPILSVSLFFSLSLSASAAKFSTNDRVFTLRGSLNVRSSAGLSSSVLGTQGGGVQGTVVSGPVSSDGYTWWNINFDSGTDGWVTEDFTTKVTTFPLPGVPGATAASPLRLRVSSNGRNLENSNGTPFFWMGDTNWVGMNMHVEDIDRYFSDMVSKGFNISQIVISWDDATPPFLKDNTDTPNEQLWQKVDWMVSDAENHGIYVAMTVMWSQDYDKYFGGDTNKAYRLGKWLGQRYANRNNIVWIISGEYDEYQSGGGDVTTIFHSMAQGLQDGGATQLKSIEPTGNESSSSRFQNTSWLAFNMLQSGPGTDNYPLTTNDYRLSPTKPVVDGEPIYEFPPRGFFSDFDSSATLIGADTIRRGAYWSVFAGAMGHTYGYVKWSTWNAQGRTQMYFLRSLVESKPILGRIPDQNIIASSLGSGTAHVQATRASDGSYAWIYIPNGAPVTIHMGVISGAINASWWNPKDGSKTSIGQYANSGDQTFDPPGSTADGNDWVLVLESSSAPTSGSSERIYASRILASE